MHARVWRYLMTLALLVIVSASSWAASDKVELSVSGKVVHAELALTEQARFRGLMFRKKLCENCGMLFVFPSAAKWAFWSKNTPLALSVAFVDGAGRIVQIVDMEPNSLKNHAAAYEVIYALEMSRGWFEKNGIATGNNIDGLFRINQKPARSPGLSTCKDCT